MNRLLIPLGALLMAGLFVLISGGAGFRESSHQAPDLVPDAALVAKTRQLPSLMPVDASVPDAAVEVVDGGLTAERIKTIGLLGREVKWAAEILPASDWQPVAGAPHTYQSQIPGRLEETLTLIVRRGRVVGMKSKFGKNAFGATAATLSPYIVGNQSAIGVYPEGMEGDPKRLTGDFEDSKGRTFYYDVTMRTEGEPPFGPAEMVIQTAPIIAPEAPAQP